MVPRTTRAAVLVETGRPLTIVELQIPELKPGQVLVNVAYSGVCHSQLNEVRGDKGPDPYLPHTLGHEGSGVVAAIGRGVTKVNPGDPVVLSWLKGSGADNPGTTYESTKGAVNSGAISTFMEHTIISENRVTPIPPSMPLKLAALLGCAIPTGAGVIFNSSGLTRGESLAIFGAGGIGQCAIVAAVSMGANPIIAIDVIPDKLFKARELGASHTVDAGKGDPVAAIRDITGGKGVRVSFECSGRVAAMEAAFESVMSSGGLCIVAGNPAHGETMRINPFSLISGKRIKGTWGGESRPDTEIPRYVDMYLKRELALDKIETEDYLLDDINQALDDLEAGRVGRAMVRISRSIGAQSN